MKSERWKRNAELGHRGATKTSGDKSARGEDD